ncbi:hypothetical protein [Bradyrhizobium sp. G127]|jgi:hypothetical protein|uniref:hypothetical protein n=1 Tax=Bradyrhizobium sp. G127 TaxID=2904800 RepID=UPI001F42E667|nr:hypothetical protein [Bradyrhizobium sp. G127]MCF2524196.1 hypothetical protein [Bradyrhizobium sp. G127]
MLSVERNAIDIHAHSFLASSFTHPSDVLANPSLTSVKKRCILAAWASDAFAVEGKPWLRQIAGHKDPIPLAEILSALRRLDDDDDPPRGGASAAVPRPRDEEFDEDFNLAVGY